MNFEETIQQIIVLVQHIGSNLLWCLNYISVLTTLKAPPKNREIATIQFRFQKSFGPIVSDLDL